MQTGMFDAVRRRTVSSDPLRLYAGQIAHQVTAFDPEQADIAVGVHRLEADTDLAAAVKQGEAAIREVVDLLSAKTLYGPVLRNRNVLKRPPSPGDIHGVSRRAQAFSQHGSRLATCVCGRCPERCPGWVPEFQALSRSEAGLGCNGFPAL